MIQIFGSKKGFDSKKAQNFFKERNIPTQFIEIKDKPISRGEFDSILHLLAKHVDNKNEAFGLLANKSSKQYTVFEHLDDQSKADFLFEHQDLLILPICRFGKNDATVGINPEIWKNWK